MSFPEVEVTRLLSSNLFKASWVVINDDARVIDSNELVEQKLQKAVKINAYQVPFPEVEAESEGFQAGISADSIDTLLDPDSERAMLKSASMEELDKARQELHAAKEELEKVKAETKQLMQEAQAEMADLREKTLQEAGEQGYQDGYRQGMEEVSALREECAAREKQLEQEYLSKMKELEPEFVKNLTRIYEHIFKVDLSGYHQLVISLLTDAMQKVDVTGNMIAHVAREDYPKVNGAKTEILERTGVPGDRVEIVSDMTLAPSQCMIETESGVYDCSLGTELSELSKKLRLLSYKDGR